MGKFVGVWYVEVDYDDLGIVVVFWEYYFISIYSFLEIFSIG